jgi:hypothetical protein
MSFENKANRVLQHAKQLVGEVRSWADFSAALFDQSTGYVAKAFPNGLQRQLFLESPQYEEINKLLIHLMNKFGVVGGANPTKSGKFVVRVPKTLHQVLEIEAKKEGVSLNQLAVSKLSLPLPTASGLAADLIVTAFNEVHEGYSQDWIIVNPEYNERYLEKCRDLGLTQPTVVLNHSLMNIRKNPKNKGRLNPTTKRSGFSDYDEYGFASEIAVRAIQRVEGATLDRILCDPVLRERFDSLALELASDQTELKLRCAALNLRKTHRLQPMQNVGNRYELVSAGPVRTIDLSRFVCNPGGYVLYDQKRPIYAGETTNLRHRIDKHLRSGLPSWLGIEQDKNLVLNYVELPVARDVRLSWLGGFINSERPLLNYQRAA